MVTLLENREPEVRQITVVFCDLVGSTELSERLDPEDLRTLIDAYRKACGAAITRYEGQVANYAGDGLMAFFGWPRAHLSEVIELSSAHARKQFEALTEQSKELSALAQKVATETVEPIKSGMNRAFSKVA